MRKEVDYIIVGLGIAGISFSEVLRRNGRSFLVIDHGSKNATQVAAGTLNPTVLKRFTPVWNVANFLPNVIPFFSSLEKQIGVSIHRESSILRIFNSEEEQNDWIVASDKHALSPYMQPKIIPNHNPNLIAPFGFGKVQQVVKVNTPQLVSGYRTWLKSNGQLREVAFHHSEVHFLGEKIEYEGVIAKHIVFCEGVGAHQNPWVQKDWIRPRKGEYVFIEAPELKLEEIVKGPHFLIPQGNNQYMVGATFNRTDTSLAPTKEAREELERVLSKMIRCAYTIVDQKVGLRPTVKDRRPVLGKLSQPHTFILNGLGTRGLMGAPTLAHQLFDYIEKGTQLPKEVCVSRFD